ncbi:MAG TPA: alpha/beta hydrolase [Solirubrobacteraceae bacterium]|nr:alpha/beta hydrolase [Solirubrobacteraceae bacterium]
MSVDEHTIELAGSPAFYRTAPAPGVPTLYVHGVPTSSDDWISFLERSGGIAPDLIGFGRSGKGGNLDYSIEGLTDFLERLLEHLGIDRVKLVVHDWGAAVGLAFAQRNPKRIERIALINGVPVFPAQDVRWHLLGRLWVRPVIGELVMGATTRGMLARTLRSGAADPDAWPDARIDSIWQQFDQGTQRAILRLYRSADERELTKTGAGLDRLDAPTLIVWGEADPWLPVDIGETYATVMPHASIDHVQRAGHWPWLDSPDVVDRVVSFLEVAA